MERPTCFISSYFTPQNAYLFQLYDLGNLILNYSYRQWLRPGHSFMRWSRSISTNFESHSNGDRWWVYHQRRYGWANRWCCLWCNWQWISNLRQSPYIYKSRGELSLLVQFTIQCVFLVYFDPKSTLSVSLRKKFKVFKSPKKQTKFFKDFCPCL